MNALFYNLEPNCYALLIPGFISNSEDLYAQILEDVDFETKNIPRLTSYYLNMLPWMDKLCERFQEISKIINQDKNNLPNSCLVNYYRNGEDYINWHADNEFKSYILNPIYSISLGDERIFQFRNESSGKTIDITLTNGSLFIMYGSELQLKYKHRILKSSSKIGRLNLTFRFRD